MGDQMGHKGDVTITAEGQQTTFPIGEWTAWLDRLQSPELERFFETGGPEVQSVYRKLVALSPATAA